MASTIKEQDMSTAMASTPSALQKATSTVQKATSRARAVDEEPAYGGDETYYDEVEEGKPLMRRRRAIM